MNIRLQDLPNKLQASVLPVYVVHGDEPLQMGEACDSIRSQLRARGYDERQVMHVDKSFNWEQLYMAANELSLFASRRIIELRMPNGKPGDKGAKALRQYAERPAEDSVLLLVSGKLDKASQNSKWFKALDSIGASVAIWPVDAQHLPAWLKQRFQSRGLQANGEAITLLAERAEGNLLAAAQEVEKIALLHQGAVVNADVVANSVADSARYDIYGLVDAALQGKSQRVVRMLSGLKSEGVEPVLLLWAITREIRVLLGLTQNVEQGESAEGAMSKARVWPKRKPLVAQALQRHSSQTWMGMLQQASRIDRMIKGLQTGNVWDELLQLSLWVAGIQILPSANILVQT